MLYWYNWFSWWWEHGCSKHVEYQNKHIRKRTVCQVGYLQALKQLICYLVFKLYLYAMTLSSNPSHFKVFKCSLNTQHHSMEFLLFWDVIQCKPVVRFWRFGTTYRSQLQVSSSPRRMIVLHDPWRWDQYIVPIRQKQTTNIHCMTFQKS